MPDEAEGPSPPGSLPSYSRKFAAIIGPFLMGFFSQIARRSNVGAVVLTRVKEAGQDE